MYEHPVVHPSLLSNLALLATAILGFLPALPTASAQEEPLKKEPLPPIGVVIEPTVNLGLSHWREEEDYSYSVNDADFGYQSGGYKTRGSSTGPVGGGFGLMLGVRLWEHLQLGGYARLDYVGQPDMYVEGVNKTRAERNPEKRSSMFALGGQLTVSHHAYAGLYAQLRAGRAFILEQSTWSAGGALGYGFNLKGAWHMGVALETTLSRLNFVDDSYDGRFEFKSFLILNDLAVRLRYRGL